MTKKKFSITFIFILLFTLYSLLFTKNSPAAIYKLIKMAEFLLLIIYIKTHINIKKDITNLTKILSLSVIWQSVLAIAQWFKQGSIFGYWFFGEQPYNSATLGIKMIDFFGTLKIPPYGTFPHPNVLAGWLTVSMIMIISWLVNCHPGGSGATDRISQRDSIASAKPNLASLQNDKNLISYFLFLISLILGSLALFLTFSYPAWIALVCSILYLVYRKINRRTQYTKYQILNTKYLLYAFCFMLFAAILFFWFPTHEPTSLTRRFELAFIAFRMWWSSPIFGVGLNNFIPRMEEFGQVISNTRFLQPVHNVYLLWLAETGMIGLWFMAYGLWKLANGLWLMANNSKLSSLSYQLLAISFLGFFDHYWLTLQQGNLILALVLGIII